MQAHERELQALKRKNITNKKELQIKRNRITAQLSRDRKKLESDFMIDKLISMIKKEKALKALAGPT